MKTITNDTYFIALEGSYYDRNNVAYQTMPELFAWSPMYNYFICPEDIRINDRHAPFLIMSFDHGVDNILADTFVDLYNTIMTICDEFAEAESMRIKKITAKTTTFKEIISLN